MAGGIELMPLYMRVSSTEGRQKQVMGPYNDDSVDRAEEYAKTRSQREGVMIEAFWICGRRRPMLLMIFKQGKMVYPKSATGLRQLKNVASCMSRGSSTVKSSAPERSSKAAWTLRLSCQNLVSGKSTRVHW